MNVLKRILNGIAYVGVTAATLYGLMLWIILLANSGNTWLTRIGFALIILALFIQGYTSGGDNNSEAKSAD